MEILQGKDPDVPVIEGLFQSFSDAPAGREIRELIYAIGSEYWKMINLLFDLDIFMNTLLKEIVSLFL